MNYLERLILFICSFMLFIMTGMTIEKSKVYSQVSMKNDVNRIYSLGVHLEDYIMDVIDETDFWEDTDSVLFKCYPENSIEWQLAVVLTYKLMDYENNKD